MQKIVILILAIFIFFSCSDKKDLDGDWSDNIKLSTKNVDFTALTDSVTITTEGEGWWIEGICFTDSTYSYNNQDDINLASDSFSIKEDAFTIERRDATTLFVKINENHSGMERIMSITFEYGDYFDHVTITQDAN